MAERILITDDEEPVRRTFVEWLQSAGWDIVIFAAADAETALLHASREPIDLAILDWNLGVGADGLQLLEDLSEFRPDLVAILVTGFAHQATPLDALRMGVRDYLDKNQDLTRERFLSAVRKQLDRIIPAKHQREWNDKLAAFRAAVERILPLVQSAAAMNEPVPFTEAISKLFRYVREATRAEDGLLVVHAEDGLRLYGIDGEPFGSAEIAYRESLAAAVVGMGGPCMVRAADMAMLGSVRLLPQETGKREILAAPVSITDEVQMVMELFDSSRPDGFSPEDRAFVGNAVEFGGELLRQSLAERRTRRTLFDAVEAALQVGTPLNDTPTPTPAILEQLRESMSESGTTIVNAERSLALAEAVRGLAIKHGNLAVDHCIREIQALRRLLDTVTDAGDA